MTKELTTIVPGDKEMESINLMVKHAVDSKYFDKIGGLAGAFSIAMYAREMGLPIMSSLFGGIRPVLGKVEIAPQLMNAMIRKAGHFLQTKSHTNDQCTIYGKRKDTGEEMTVVFSVEDAKRAKIFKSGGAWETYPKNMVYKSALANLARWLFPDVIGMAYVEGEINENEEVENKKNETIESSSDVKPSEFTSDEIQSQFKEKFKEIENMDYDLAEFIEFTAKKSTNKTVVDVMKYALASVDRFTKSYLAWVEKKKPVEETSAEEISKERSLV